MSVAVHISPEHMSREDYERLINELEAHGAGDPPGRTFHAAYGEDDLEIMELWDSPEQFEAHRERMLAAVEAAGLSPEPVVDIQPVHSARPD